MMTYVPPALVVLGALLAVWGAWRQPDWLTGAAGMGWLGLMTAAFAVQFGDRVGLEVAPIPASIAMAGAAALVVFPVTASTDAVRKVGGTVAGLLAIAGAGGAVAFEVMIAGAPWPNGALLLAAHWATLGAAVSSALIGAVLQVGPGRVAFEDGASSVAESAAAWGRDCSARAVGLVWLAWTLAILVHWRFLGAPGIGSRAEWFGLGISCLVTGGLLLGWRLGRGTGARVRRVAAAIWVAGVLIAGIWLSIGFGSPFQLTLGA